MIFVENFLLSAKGTIDKPLQKKMIVCKGLIYRVEVFFPPGCAALAHISINDGGFRVWPSNPDSYFASDGSTIAFDDLYLKETEPYLFNLVGYNTDDTYDHTVTIRLGLVLKEAYQARFLPHKTWSYFEKMMERLELSQKEERERILAQSFAWTEGLGTE